MAWDLFDWKRRAVQAVKYGLRFGPRICLACIALLSLVPGPLRPHTGLPGQKEHFLAYFLTALVLGSKPREQLSYRASVAAALCAYAGVLETLQIWVPGRSAQLIDFAASSGGAIGGVVVSAVFWGLQTSLAARPKN